MHVCDHSIREGVGSKAAMGIKTTQFINHKSWKVIHMEEALLAGFVG
jgi:hypothetical protein